uniref:Uncharacterized protein n=1 Tax=Opuntia streptacantha TaxID=393608 RepID=A0A7C9D1Q5_OPUST
MFLLAADHTADILFSSVARSLSLSLSLSTSPCARCLMPRRNPVNWTANLQQTRSSCDIGLNSAAFHVIRSSLSCVITYQNDEYSSCNVGLKSATFHVIRSSTPKNYRLK